MFNFDKSILQLNKDYIFNPDYHTYYWNGKKVDTSVTKFIKRYFKEFDTEGLSYNYALKHGLLQEEVKRQWKEAGDVSAMAGTIIHEHLEAAKNNTTVNEDYSKAINAGLEEKVRERVSILMPKADKYLEDTRDLLIPIATEYTVGHKDKLAGNIDLLAYNKEDDEIQIWDYKNTKAIDLNNRFANCFAPFQSYPDSNFYHYSMQLSCYKAMAQELLGIKIGKMKLVHFNYTTKKANYNLYEVEDFSDIMAQEIKNLDIEPISLFEELPASKPEVKLYSIRNGIYGEALF